jgi:hypothetical protein
MTAPRTASLNYALIHARAAEIGLAGPAFTRLVGVRLEDLEEDLDQRTLSLTAVYHRRQRSDRTPVRVHRISDGHGVDPER